MARFLGPDDEHAVREAYQDALDYARSVGDDFPARFARKYATHMRVAILADRDVLSMPDFYASEGGY